MPFRPRNPYYLRISETNVLPLYVYLDERHLDWMSDRVLQHVLADLRPLILPKLQAETGAHIGPGGPPNAKKGTVDVHKGDFYQFCFFFRRTEPHSVLVKARTFVAAPPHPPKIMRPAFNPPHSKPGSGKRKGRTPVTKGAGTGHKKRKTKGKEKARMDIDEIDESAISTGDNDSDDRNLSGQVTSSVRRSSRISKKLVAGGYREEESGSDGFGYESVSSIETQMTAPGIATIATSDMPLDIDETSLEINQDGPVDTTVAKDKPMDTGPATNIADANMDMNEPPPEPSVTVNLELEEDESKPKPLLKLGYSSFTIYGHCLCVVVEPWPPFRVSTGGSSAVDLRPGRAASVAPPNFMPSGDGNTLLRERTPLFLPEFDKDETPAPFLQEKSPISPHNDRVSTQIQDEYRDDDGMMQFSQILNSTGEFQVGVADDYDGLDGAVFFGDADEARES